MHHFIFRANKSGENGQEASDEVEVDRQKLYQNAHTNQAYHDAMEKMVFEDFNSPMYTSKSTINFDTWGSLLNIHKIIGKVEYIDPRGYINIAWLFLQSSIFLYNAWVIPMRAVFSYVQEGNLVYAWLFLDYLGDIIYLLDVAIYKKRVLFMENGFWVKDRSRLVKHYMKDGTFIYDLVALFPSDMLYFFFGIRATFLRLPRILKFVAFLEFTERLDSILAKPFYLRIFKTVTYMLYLIHLNACAYYAISVWEGINSNDFVYNGQGNAYIRCFYFATKTATSIGKNKKPTNTAEIVFMTASWLMGVFIFAILIGDIRDIVSNARRPTTQFQRRFDAVTKYMNDNKVNKSVQDRVKMWLSYTWSRQNIFDENKLLEFLPLKMRTDIAMRVHFSTLRKVKLFKNCEPSLLKDLVVLLKLVIYLPGDYICRKGDKGKEMFIIQTGQVQVLGGPDNRRVLATLEEGSVFGEIALLGVGGMNRRTADVISRGFSNIFVLKKTDLEMVLKNYPDAKQILNIRAKRLIRENELRNKQDRKLLDQTAARNTENVIFPIERPAPKDPAILKAILTLLPSSSLSTTFISKKRMQPNTSSIDPASYTPSLTIQSESTKPPQNRPHMDSSQSGHRTRSFGTINSASKTNSWVTTPRTSTSHSDGLHLEARFRDFSSVSSTSYSPLSRLSKPGKQNIREKKLATNYFLVCKKKAGRL